MNSSIGPWRELVAVVLSRKVSSIVVTLSKPRHSSFHGLSLDERLEHRKAKPQCSLRIIDLRTGTIADWTRLDGTLVTELYDSVALPSVRQPMAVGFQTNKIERLMLIDDEDAL